MATTTVTCRACAVVLKELTPKGYVPKHQDMRGLVIPPPTCQGSGKDPKVSTVLTLEEQRAERIKCLQAEATQNVEARIVGALNGAHEAWMSARADVARALGTDDAPGNADTLSSWAMPSLVRAERLYYLMRQATHDNGKLATDLVKAVRETHVRVRSDLCEFNFRHNSTCPWSNAKEQEHGKAASEFLRQTTNLLRLADERQAAREELGELGA